MRFDSRLDMQSFLDTMEGVGFHALYNSDDIMGILEQNGIYRNIQLLTVKIDYNKNYINFKFHDFKCSKTCIIAVVDYGKQED